MKENLGLALLAVLLAGCATCQKAAQWPDSPVMISIARLLCAPELYHGRDVVVTGYLWLEPDSGSYLCLHREDAEQTLCSNAVLLDPPIPQDQMKTEFYGRYVTVVGTFDCQRMALSPAGATQSAQGCLTQIREMKTVGKGPSHVWPED